jgi:hypothetical protein
MAKPTPSEIVQSFQQRLVWIAALTVGLARRHTVEDAAETADFAVKAFDKRFPPLPVEE